MGSGRNLDLRFYASWIRNSNRDLTEMPEKHSELLIYEALM